MKLSDGVHVCRGHDPKHHIHRKKIAKEKNKRRGGKGEGRKAPSLVYRGVSL